MDREQLAAAFAAVKRGVSGALVMGKVADVQPVKGGVDRNGNAYDAYTSVRVVVGEGLSAIGKLRNTPMPEVGKPAVFVIDRFWDGVRGLGFECTQFAQADPV